MRKVKNHDRKTSIIEKISMNAHRPPEIVFETDQINWNISGSSVSSQKQTTHTMKTNS